LNGTAPQPEASLSVSRHKVQHHKVQLFLSFFLPALAAAVTLVRGTAFHHKHDKIIISENGHNTEFPKFDIFKWRNGKGLNFPKI
jgi:hypothetical protein